MPNKRVHLDTVVLQQVELLGRDTSKSFQELADEAFADLLKKHRRVVGLEAQLKETLRRAPANDSGHRRRR
jgi:hypothetical protein